MKQQRLIMLVVHKKNDVSVLMRTLARTNVKAPIKAVASREEAMAYLKNEAPYADQDENPAPSVVLLDLGLPDDDGFKLLKWLRGRPELKAVRIVVLTSSPHLTRARRAYQFGANSFLTKPLELSNVDALTAAIECAGFWIEGQVHEF